MLVHAGTALGKAAEVRWDIIELQRGDMLLMVATSRHHGIPALQAPGMGYKGPFLSCRAPMPSTATTNPTPPTLIPLPPMKPWPLLVTCPARTAPHVAKNAMHRTLPMLAPEIHPKF